MSLKIDFRKNYLMGNTNTAQTDDKFAKLISCSNLRAERKKLIQAARAKTNSNISVAVSPDSYFSYLDNVKYYTELDRCELLENEIYKKPETLADCQKFKSDFQRIYLAWHKDWYAKMRRFEGSYDFPLDKPAEWFFDAQQKKVYREHQVICEKIELKALNSKN